MVDRLEPAVQRRPPTVPTNPLANPYLLHPKEVSRVSLGAASAGGVGTSDGIALSGLIATLLVL